MDSDPTTEDEWFDTFESTSEFQRDSPFDEYGEYRRSTVVNYHDITQHDLENCTFPDDFLYLPFSDPNYKDDWSPSMIDAFGMIEEYDDVGILEEYYDALEVHASDVTPTEDKPPPEPPPTNTKPIQHLRQEVDYTIKTPYFCWLPLDIVKKTFQATTQFARIPMSTHLTKHYKSPNPALNVHRRNEAIATDTVYADVPAVDDGSACAQIFVGTESSFLEVYGMKSEKQFVNTLQDTIRRRGAPTGLISDRAQVEISNQVLDLLRAYVISDWQSEPHQQHQNICEQRYQDLKRIVNRVMDRTNTPPECWLLALSYVSFVLNHTALKSLNWITPIQALLGSTPDISVLLRFFWYQPVYYKLDDSNFPSESPELRGRFVGISETVGHAMTYKILTDDTKKIIHRSNVRSALDADSANLKADFINGELPEEPYPDISEIVKSVYDSKDTVDKTTLKIIEPPEELIGKTFLMDTNEDGTKHRARIIKAIEDYDYNLKKNPSHVKFLCSVNNDEYKEAIAYADILRYIEKDLEHQDTVWKFKRIVAHEGPLRTNHPNYKGSLYNVRIEWEDSSITSEPLGIIASDDSVTCAIYARDNELLDMPGWKRFKSIAKRQKKLLRMANQAKLRSYRTAPKYMNGFEIPKNYKHAMYLDDRNGNDKSGR
mmetsp:Transcript_22842/g.34620  ORF Transcript_22842/g.34620 Transcript_22842/m.34620 type:complete len:658 (+) Transcript_22842:2551-4524(+)